MKKILFFLLLIPFLGSAQFSESQYQQLGTKTTHVKALGSFSADSALKAPAGDNTWLPRNLSKAGYLYVDTAGGNKGLHYYIDGFFVRVVDTTWSGLLTTRDRFGFAGEDVRATIGRSFSMANFALKLDSLGDQTRFVSIPKTVGGRSMSFVSTNGTDSAFMKVSGDLTTGLRTVLIQVNKTSLSNVASIQVRGGAPTDIQINVHGALQKESIIAMDSFAVQLYRRSPTLRFPAALYLYDDSAVLWSGVSRESQIGLYPDGSADQWALNRLAWRTFDSTGKIVIEKNLVELYAGPNEIELENPTGITIEPYNQNLYIDSVQHKLTATAKMLTWDSVTGRVESRAIPSGGGGGSQTLDNVFLQQTYTPVITHSSLVDITNKNFTIGGGTVSLTANDSTGISTVLGRRVFISANAPTGTSGIFLEPNALTGTSTSYNILGVSTESGKQGRIENLAISTGLSGSTSNALTANISTGISGGQTITGGTGASENLTIRSTSNATKGNVDFTTAKIDQANNWIIANAANTNKLYLGEASGFPLIGFGSSAPSISTYAFLGDVSGGGTILNGQTYLALRTNNNNLMYFSTSGITVGGGTSPAASAYMDITGTAKGFLPPRMTKTQRDAISSPATGLMIFQTDNTPGIRVYNGTSWMKYTETTD